MDGPTSKEKCVRLRHQTGGGRGVKRFQKRGRDQSGCGWDNKRQKLSNDDCDQPYDDRRSDGWPADRPKFLQFVPTPPFILDEKKRRKKNNKDLDVCSILELGFRVSAWRYKIALLVLCMKWWRTGLCLVPVCPNCPLCYFFLILFEGWQVLSLQREQGHTRCIDCYLSNAPCASMDRLLYLI